MYVEDVCIKFCKKTIKRREVRTWRFCNFTPVDTFTPTYEHDMVCSEFLRLFWSGCERMLAQIYVRSARI